MPMANNMLRPLSLAVALVLLAPSLASAQTWPTKPVTLVAPFQAGGGVDLLARRVGGELSEKLGQPFIIDNRAGANGNIGAAAVAKSEPDGYTLLIATPGIAVQNKMVYKTMPFDADRDFVPIVLISKAPHLVLVNPKLPIKTMAELIAYAKANPGKINSSSSGVGSQGHITLELLKKLAGVEITHVPYRTSARAIPTSSPARSRAASITYTVTTSQVNEGLIRALAITSKVRPRAAGRAHAGRGRAFQASSSTGWYAVVAPRGTPADVRHKINAVVNAWIKTEKGIEELDDLGMQPAGGTPADVTAWVKSENDRWGPVIKGLKIEDVAVAVAVAVRVSAYSVLL